MQENRGPSNQNIIKRFLFTRRKVNTPDDAPKPRSPWYIKILKIIGYTIALGLLYFVALDLNFLWLFGKSPSISDLNKPKQNLASEVYTADGVMIGRYFTENRSPIQFKDLNPKMVEALICTEDIRFYQHSGIDFKSIGGALIETVKGGNRGGSTITQQLAKNLYRTRTDVSKGLLGNIPGLKTIIAKSKEWLTSLKIEWKYPKNEILTLYFNTVDFGSNTFGIKIAARTFFDTTVNGLTVPQSATLVGLLKAPSSFSPIMNPEKSLWRRNVVLAQMLKYGKLTKEEYTTYCATPMDLNFHVEQPFEGAATYFRGVVNNYLKEWCKNNNEDLYTSGLKIYTTLDSRMQTLAEEALREHLNVEQRLFNNHWEGKNPWVDANNKEIPGFIDSFVRQLPYYKYLTNKYKDNPLIIARMLNHPKKMKVYALPLDSKHPEYERETTFSTIDSLTYYKRFLHGGFVAINPHTGFVRAWAGGLDYKYFKFDHVKQSKRQPGSTFKAFVYAAAFEKGYSPCDRLTNKPVTIKYKEDGKDMEWNPQNADREFDGDSMTFRHAFAMSINVIAAQVTQLIGWNTVAEYAQKCGIQSKLLAVPSICLGSSDVSLLELTGAFGTFINNGQWVEPIFVTKITNNEGKVIAEFKPKRRQAISPETAFLMTDMLKGGIDEGGTSSNLWAYDLFPYGKKRNELGGKTGTSSNHSDGWFIGVSKDLVGGAWVGGQERCIHFRSTEMGEGAKTALPIFGKFLEKVYRHPELGIGPAEFPKPTVKIKKQFNCHTAYKSRKKQKDSIEVKDSTTDN